MSAIASALRRHWLEVAWAAFALLVFFWGVFPRFRFLRHALAG